MTVLTHVDWQYGSDSGTEYTTAAPERPVGRVWTIGDASVVVESASPWNGQSLLNCATYWYQGFQLSSAATADDVAVPSGRFLFESEPPSPDTNEDFFVLQTGDENVRIRCYKMAGSPDYLRILLYRAPDAQNAEVIFSSFPSGPFALEVIYDFNNGTPSQWLRARWWLIGGTPGSFTNATNTSGTATTPAQLTVIWFSSPGNGDYRSRAGRLIISDDVDEDLSTWTPATPRVLRPVSVLSAGGWVAVGAANLAAAINETTPSDAEYAKSVEDPNNDYFEVSITPSSDPLSSTGHVLNYRLFGSGGQGMTVALRQGASTQIAAWTHAPMTNGWATYQQTLSAGEANSITDYTDLRLRFTAL